MTVSFRYACRNRACSRYREERDGQGACPDCGWITTLAAIFTAAGKPSSFAEAIRRNHTTPARWPDA